MSDSLHREKVIWGCILLLGGMVFFGQLAVAVKPAPEVVFPEVRPVAVAPSAPIDVPAALAQSVTSADLLVDAVIQVESAGNPSRVGNAGERGLMQIKERTWQDVTRSLYGESISFDRAFEPALNRSVGKAYLAYLQTYLLKHQHAWKADARSLLLAAYNAGPGAVKKAGFDIGRLPASTQSYVSRAGALHEVYVEGANPRDPGFLLTQSASGPQDS